MARAYQCICKNLPYENPEIGKNSWYIVLNRYSLEHIHYQNEKRKQQKKKDQHKKTVPPFPF